MYFNLSTAFIGSESRVVARARSRPDTISSRGSLSFSLFSFLSLSLSLCVFLSSRRCFHAEKRDRAGKNGPIESRKDGCEAITSASAPAHLARATREACRVCMRGTLIYVSFYARTRERRRTSVHPCFTCVYARVCTCARALRTKRDNSDKSRASTGAETRILLADLEAVRAVKRRTQDETKWKLDLDSMRLQIK